MHHNMGKMIWPAVLSFYYPHLGMHPIGQVISSIVLLTVTTGWTSVRLRAQPYLSVGWFFFLGTLVPVIGIVQVGGHAMADRYTYVPLIGLFIMIAWGLTELMDVMFRKGKAIVAVSAIVVVLILSVLYFFRCVYGRIAFFCLHMPLMLIVMMESSSIFSLMR
jgi:hypothetical protein